MASSDAVTPAAQIDVRASTLLDARRRGAWIATEPAATSTTVCPASTVTPSRSSARVAFRESDGGKLVSTRSAASTSSTRAVRVSTLRKSLRSVSFASSAIWPAISTPVGPAPTTTNVSQLRRRSGSGSASAASKASRMRLRMSSAPSSDFSSGACSRQSSWPKYE